MSAPASPFLRLTPLLGVFDMPAALAFYQGTLGFGLVSASPVVDTPEGRFPHWAWLRLGGVDLMLNTLHDAGERPATPVPARSLAHGDTALYITCADLDAAHARLAQRGLAAGPPHRAPYGLRCFSATDPDGYVLVFQEAPPGA